MCCFFFKQKTAYEMRMSDWSSDVCSSDLPIIVIAKADVPGATDEELLATNQLIRFRRVAWGFGRMIDRELTRRGIETRSHMEVDSLEAIFSLAIGRASCRERECTYV